MLRVQDSDTSSAGPAEEVEKSFRQELLSELQADQKLHRQQARVTIPCRLSIARYKGGGELLLPAAPGEPLLLRR